MRFARLWLAAIAVLMLMMALTIALAPAPRDDVSGRDVVEATPGPETAQEFVDARLFVTEDSKPALVEAELGDTIRLEIHGTAYDGVELEGLELFAAVSPEAPAIFEVLAEEAGTFPIVFTETDREVGRIEVSRRPG